MQIEDLIEAFNLTISQYRKLNNIDSKSHIVLQKNIEYNNTFKAYKTYVRTLWYVNGRNKYIIFKVSHTDKVLDGQEEKIIRAVDMQLAVALFEFMGTEYYNQIINGEYYGGAEK